MTLLRKVARAAFARWTVLRAGRGLAALRRDEHPSASRLAFALRRALDGPTTPDKREWFDRIESLRTQLETDTSVVSITDYGAGSSHDERTEEQMLNGVVVEKTMQQVCRASKPSFWAAILFEIVREFKPQSGLEMGTCLGISAAYQGSAMEMNGSGRLATMEGAPALAEVSAKHLSQLGLGERVAVITGRFGETLAPTMEQYAPIDYAFIDGHHDEAATIDYFEQLLPQLADESILIFDDISWTEGMRRAWEVIVKHPRVGLAVDLGAIGVCVTGDNVSNRSNHRISFRGL